MPRIVVSVTNDLVTDQRVRKVSDTLQQEGYEIVLIGRKLPDSLPISRPYKTIRMSLLFKKGFLFYAEYTIRLFITLFFLKKDILLANDLDTLFPNYLIAKIFNKKIVYDSHELFTEVPELINRPKVQKVWLTIEKFIFPKLKNVYTVCESIADYYSDAYKVKVSVIRNLPLQKNNPPLLEFPIDTKEKKIVLYQGAVNEARGLELLIDTMSLLEDWVLIIIGEGSIKQELLKNVVKLEYKDRIHFMDRQLPENLAKLTPLADVGVSVEEDLGLNYHYALPNKIFDYIHAKVPVLVSNLPEMIHVIEEYKVGMLLVDRSPYNVAKVLKTMADKKKEFWDFEKAIKDLNWEKESEKLKKIYATLG